MLLKSCSRATAASFEDIFTLKKLLVVSSNNAEASIYCPKGILTYRSLVQIGKYLKEKHLKPPRKIHIQTVWPLNAYFKGVPAIASDSSNT